MLVERFKSHFIVQIRKTRKMLMYNHDQNIQKLLYNTNQKIKNTDVQFSYHDQNVQKLLHNTNQKIKNADV